MSLTDGGHVLVLLTSRDTRLLLNALNTFSARLHGRDDLDADDPIWGELADLRSRLRRARDQAGTLMDGGR